MCKEVLFTGVAVSEQMKKAREILQNEVIPREQLYQERKRKGELTWQKNINLKKNA